MTLFFFGLGMVSSHARTRKVVFGAYCETGTERVATDYGDDNPSCWINAMTTGSKSRFKCRIEVQIRRPDNVRVEPENRMGGSVCNYMGLDLFLGPGLDHGVFLPFKKCSGPYRPSVYWLEHERRTRIKPKLDSDYVLLLSGGLAVHNLRHIASFWPHSAEAARGDDQTILTSAVVADAILRSITDRLAHRRDRHTTSSRCTLSRVYVAASGRGRLTKIIANNGWMRYCSDRALNALAIRLRRHTISSTHPPLTLSCSCLVQMRHYHDRVSQTAIWGRCFVWRRVKKLTGKPTVYLYKNATSE
ncbi:hypothetical protein B0H12DRAFT_1217823 [Mycena haematopus]|nr:hypothetical protein B0H12DRAFT_1217823 [Mycena haematopus]